MSRNPQQLRSCVAMVPREVSMRVERLISLIGRGPAMRALAVSASTLEAARDEGRVQRKTLERLCVALEREEREVAS